MHRAHRLADLTVAPRVTVSIDTNDQPPRILQLRGTAVVTTHDGLVDEYVLAAHRYLGAHADEYLTSMSGPGVSMARIAVTPTWVGLIDFDSRPPGALCT
ncbi:MAG: hypothetical protein AAFZ07_19305 [Actinomycetota bacterium]